MVNDNTLKVVAIIQARMGSKRLPGKVLMNIVGKPMLWHIVNRLTYCDLINDIVVATSINKKDDAIEEFCKKNNILYYRGSEDDVLDRYYMAAELFKADIIVRVTGDNPFIDPAIVEKAIAAILERPYIYDFTCNTLDNKCPFGLGIEVITIAALEKCWVKAKQNHQREHVTTYIYENRDLFNVKNIVLPDILPNMRCTVDEDKDLEFTQAIFDKLYKENAVFFLENVVELLKKEPKLCQINKNIKQKKF